MNILDALLIDRGRVITLVGAGGKTTVMYALGREAVKRGIRVVITTTTKIYAPPDEEGMAVILDPGPEIVPAVCKALKKHPLVVAGAGINRENKVIGLNRSIVPGFLGAGADMVVVEADGSAGRPFKAPGEGEPVIPGDSGLVVPVVGIDCIGRPLDAENTHRPEKITELTGAGPGEAVTPAVVAGVFIHPGGYYKDVPPGCRWVPFINKVENEVGLQHARRLAVMLGKGGAKRVVIGAARNQDPVSEVMVF
ncbi:MAG: selenium cofactor biosynthesis protein YqeC [Bacillota bacterium]